MLRVYEMCRQVVLNKSASVSCYEFIRFVSKWYWEIRRALCVSIVWDLSASGTRKFWERFVLRVYKICRQVVLVNSAGVLCFGIMRFVGKWYWENRRAFCVSILWDLAASDTGKIGERFVLRIYKMCRQVVLENRRVLRATNDFCQQVVLDKSASILCFEIMRFASKWYWENRRAFCTAK